MQEKDCPGCGQTSYSSTDKGSWICPYCKTDLTEVISWPPRGNEDDTNVQ